MVGHRSMMNRLIAICMTHLLLLLLLRGLPLIYLQRMMTRMVVVSMMALMTVQPWSSLPQQEQGRRSKQYRQLTMKHQRRESHSQRKIMTFETRKKRNYGKKQQKAAPIVTPARNWCRSW
uniref:Putative secreted protein n=1 Tax=Anopheles darlingi TaxID=43151 RepID=A0A2M4DRM6_ANODA